MSAVNFNPRINDLPQDLSSLIGTPTLIRLAFEAVDATPWPRALTPLPERTPEPVMRTVMSFAYATGLFASNEISVRARADATLRYLCANDIPAFEEIRAFRRHNISHLRETLARIIHAAWMELYPDATDARSFLPFLAEADRRIRCSIEADSAALDD